MWGKIIDVIVALMLLITEILRGKKDRKESQNDNKGASEES